MNIQKLSGSLNFGIKISNRNKKKIEKEISEKERFLPAEMTDSYRKILKNPEQYASNEAELKKLEIKFTLPTVDNALPQPYANLYMILPDSTKDIILSTKTDTNGIIKDINNRIIEHIKPDFFYAASRSGTKGLEELKNDFITKCPDLKQQIEELAESEQSFAEETDNWYKNNPHKTKSWWQFWK